MQAKCFIAQSHLNSHSPQDDCNAENSETLASQRQQES